MHHQLARVKEDTATNPYTRGIHRHVAQMVVTDRDTACQAWFRRVTAGEPPGVPRCTGRNRCSSAGCNEDGNRFKLDRRPLRRSGFGRVAARRHRPLEGTITPAQIARNAGTWDARVVRETVPSPLSPTGRAIGIAVGVTNLITTNEGEKVARPAWYRVAQRRGGAGAAAPGRPPREGRGELAESGGAGARA